MPKHSQTKRKESVDITPNILKNILFTHDEFQRLSYCWVYWTCINVIKQYR